MGGELGHRPLTGGGDAGVVQPALGLLKRNSREDLRDDLVEFGAVRDAGDVPGEPGVGRQFGALQHPGAEGLPLPLVLQAHVDDLAGGSGYRSVGRDGCVARSRARRFRTAVAGVVVGVAHPLAE